MSEREIRSRADHPWSCASHRVQRIEKRHGVEEEIHYRCDCGLLEALSAEPDLVMVLRMLRERRAGYAEAATGHVFAPPDVARNTLDVLELDIEGRFGIRLTDDGWEWTGEEGSDAE